MSQQGGMEILDRVILPTSCTILSEANNCYIKSIARRRDGCIVDGGSNDAANYESIGHPLNWINFGR